MRRSALLLIFAAVLVASPACGDGGSGSDDGDSAEDASGTTQAFFAQTAHAATVRADRLVLDGIVSSVTAISDRPARSVTRIGLASFVDGWRSRFGRDPPNAIVSGEMSGGERSAQLVLDDPSYDAASRRLTYEAEPIDDRATLPTLRLAGVSLVLDLAPVTVPVYTLRATPAGGKAAKTITLRELANVRVVINEAPGGQGIELNTESAQLDFEAKVDNDTSSEVGVEIERNSHPIAEQNMPSGTEFIYKPPTP